ncbi:MAG TPA: Ig-like domain-containing protein, partial [Cytophagales bacterium]|nr:Ig-like domain-containing protein [Cytophagales bacterium]
DGGNTFNITDVSSQFKAHGNGMGRQNGEKLLVDPNNSNTLYCGTRWNGLFRSINAGQTWSRLSSLEVSTTPNENGISFVVADPSAGTEGGNSKRIFVGVSRTGTNLYMSNNAGGSFTALTGAPTNLMPQRAVLDGAGNLIVTYANGAGPHAHWSLPEPMDNGQIWKYNITNNAWTNITPANLQRAFGGITVDPNNSNRMVASTVNTYLPQDGGSWGDRIFLTTDGGVSWKDLFANGMTIDPNGSSWIYGHAIHWAGSVEFNPFNSNQVWVTSGNGIFVCDDITAAKTTWKFSVKGLEETVPLDIVSIPGAPLFSVIGDYDGFKHTDVAQFPPIHTPRMGTTTGIAYAALNTNYLVRVGDKIYYTTNQGSTWSQASTMNGKKGKVAVSANGGVILHCPETSNVTYRSTNNGSSWSTVNGLSMTEALPVADPVNTNKFYAYNPASGTMLLSTDAGANFTSAGNAGSGGSKIVRTVPGKEGHLWVALYNGGLTRSTNSAQTFSKIANVSYCAAVGLGKAAPGASYHTLYIWGTVNNVVGVYRSTDEGASWTRINDDAHEYGGPGNGQFVIGDMNTYGRVYMSTAGRGIAYADLQTAQSPTVSLTAPLNNATICQGKAMTLTATAADADGQISKVEFYDGTQLIASINQVPYTYLWARPTIGSHSITAKAYDNEGTSTSSAAATISVFSSPEVTITSPTGSSYSGNTIEFTADVVSQDISKVLFYDNNILVAEDAQSPYSTTIAQLTTGSHVLKVIAMNSNNCADTATVSLDIVTSTIDNNLENQITLYPNPFNTRVNVALKGQFDYEIYDVTGMKVAYGVGSNDTAIGFCLGKGLYLLKVIQEDKHHTVKIEKE